MRKQYHGREYPQFESLPEGVGIYVTADSEGNRREELSFSSGITRKEFGEMAGRAARLHRQITGHEISISQAEQYIMSKIARACRYRAKLLYDKVNYRLDQQEREHGERLRRVARREQQLARREANEYARAQAV